MTERPTCETCPYWARNVHQDGTTSDTFGGCHRHAPAPILYNAMRQDDPKDDVVLWCETFDTDWCGEHPDMDAWIRADRPPTA